jgi:hypothetical protein
MTEDPWMKVWLQGGEADGWQYMTLIEPDPIIYVARNAPELAARHGAWMRMPSPIQGVTLIYRREAHVEQFAFERIYYPVN